MTENGRAFWLTQRLWKLAAGLRVHLVPLDEIAELDQNCWFGLNSEPTCRAVAEHARKIRDADLSFPIILSADGRLMDGGHRIAKALISGHSEIRAVRFSMDPEPDYIVPLEQSRDGLC